ncbi:hypothetical protein CCHR01_16759 [Colletotrichum chrysophilum]|uniref:Uncharacterized protein n=1 Tax=Colletotrichum chrysophilum TaxID=1836956 RepID=A0AAD9A3T7_9PEZI|nr:hypothetical protein CCHR01_16759 [Colletotrichum chrysophilum]
MGQARAAISGDAYVSPESNGFDSMTIIFPSSSTKTNSDLLSIIARRRPIQPQTFPSIERKVIRAECDVKGAEGRDNSRARRIVLETANDKPQQHQQAMLNLHTPSLDSVGSPLNRSRQAAEDTCRSQMNHDYHCAFLGWTGLSLPPTPVSRLSPLEKSRESHYDG